MKCDRCDKIATVHELTQVNGVKIERHLCEQCAKDTGIASTGVPAAASLLGMSVNITTTRVAACPSCKTTFGEFKQHGLLGCADCYRVFENQLAPLLARAHQGGDRHRGKAPRRMLGEATSPETEPSLVAELAERAKRLAALRNELDGAVKSEQYERAARLRDELKRLSSQAQRQGHEPRMDDEGRGE
ncbi:MAG: UvrB/UvrC motif-containing protein [Phycisphaerales bacterium]|jgi:protein arginine kinase activator